MASVWAELRRRNVVKVAVAYAIVGWLVIEIASVMGPALNLPDWSTSFVAFLLILGFPVALVLSWAYELTPQGIERTASVPVSESITRVTGRKLDFVIIGLLAVAVVFMFVDNYLPESGPFAGAEIDPASLSPEVDDPPVANAETGGDLGVLPNSVAVLPLENMSPDPDNAYFAAGIHDTILNELAKLQNMNVIARTSVLRYADGQTPISEIAEELNVETVMEGSVQYADGRILVTAQLIDPETSAHLWSDNYDREFSDIFAIQADIAMNIANAVEAEFSDAEQQSIEAVPTDSPAAYSFYLRALTSRLTDGTTLVAAVEDLDRAIALDPEFALAYGEKAVRLAARGRLSPQLESEREQRAQESAEQALALDPNLAIAHTALAALHIANGRWNEAQQELEIAYEINPKDPLLLLNYGTLMRDIGEYTESVRLLEQAAALDPGANRNQLGISYRMAGDYEASRTAFQHSIELNPADPNPVGQLAYTEVAAGDYDEGLRQLQLSEDLGFAGSTFRVAQLAYAYSRIGREQDVERLFERFQEMAGATPPSDSEWVMVYLAVGEIEPAFRHLQSVADDPAGEYGVGIVQANVYSDPVLNEPRFAELRSQINSLD